LIDSERIVAGITPSNEVMSGIGRSLIVLGIVLVVAGLLLSFGDRLPVRFGRLPGDIVYRGKNTTVYLPIVTCILLSVVLSVVMWLFGRSR
jgi:hypothetical protein